MRCAVRRTCLSCCQMSPGASAALRSGCSPGASEANGIRGYAQITLTMVWRCAGLSWASRSSAYSPPSRTGALSLPSCSTALVYSSVMRRSVASRSVRLVAISWWCWRRKASMSPTAAPAPAPAASPVRTASSRELARSVPGLAPLAMVSSHIVTTKATMTTAATAASIHHQAEIGRHAGLTPSRARWLLGSFMADIISRQ
jgi:hypothetical protein